jgi:hypothetical protein
MKEPNPIRLKESWVLCFLLGIVMLNFPFIEIFNKTTQLFGIPLLILYLMLGWALSICVVFLFTRYLDEPARNTPDLPSEEQE